MKLSCVGIGIIVLACGILAADEQPGFSNTNLLVVVSVTPGLGKEWVFPDEGPASVAGTLLEDLNNDGVAAGVTFTEPNGVQPNLRIDMVFTNAGQGTDQISATASVSGLGRGHLFDASSGQATFTHPDDAIKALADDIFRWIRQGWTYNNPPPPNYTPLSYGYSGTGESRFGVFGVGFSLGRGAGLFAGYASLQPLDLLGVEFDYGTQPCATPVGPDQITVWPGMLSAKLQIFGGRRSRPSQVGFEIAADWAEQAGWGAHGAFLLRLRPDPHFNVDMSLGGGHFFNQEEATAMYEKTIADKLNQGVIPNLSLGFIGPLPNYLVGGIGLSLSF